ncbi:putative signal transducing protein [Sediminibacterium ginsengisoli]|uniref:Putative signal transducing protein n=1 Tax=Sediminibacterium ginsengisoli TaxID=413434 RepID=A0A1T4JPQ9_9BACT|nr:DUF2007 domain-containing protein [Sediminibacterium ginsengisoli]SJZ32133.1 Putative signal transducing protein [Sediminibacterium ginsengisoli]
MDPWKKVYATGNYAQANILKGMLEENEIPVQVLNKQDSSYPMFGIIEVYVPGHLLATAQQLMNSSLLN